MAHTLHSEFTRLVCYAGAMQPLIWVVFSREKIPRLPRGRTLMPILNKCSGRDLNPTREERDEAKLYAWAEEKVRPCQGGGLTERSKPPSIGEAEGGPVPLQCHFCRSFSVFSRRHPSQC